MREELLAAKAAELTEQLQPWAREILDPGERLVVSLRVEGTALNMKVGEFFTLERLLKFTSSNLIARRTYNCIILCSPYKHEIWDSLEHITIREFLEHVSEKRLLLTPNFGYKCLLLVQAALAEAGLALRA